MVIRNIRLSVRNSEFKVYWTHDPPMDPHDPPMDPHDPPIHPLSIVAEVRQQIVLQPVLLRIR